MPHPYLRVYFGPEDTNAETLTSGDAPCRQQTTVSLGEILPALADAINMRRAWVSDFADDPITISTDLYEVLLAYKELRPAG